MRTKSSHRPKIQSKKITPNKMGEYSLRCKYLSRITSYENFINFPAASARPFSTGFAGESKSRGAFKFPFVFLVFPPRPTRGV